MIARRDGYEIDDDRARIDVDLTWNELRRAYWSPNVPRDVVERALANSLAFGLYGADGAQLGFARAVTDRATYAWIADVFVVEGARGRGLGTWLMEVVLEHPDLQRLRQVVLATRDAHGLYERFGFVREGERTMVRRASPADLYGTPAEKLTE